MNRHQAILLGVAAANIVIMLLFPPFDSMVMGKGMPTLDAYYFVFDRQYNKTINTDLLFLQVGWVMLNGMCGLLLLRRPSGEQRIMTIRSAVVVGGALNLGLVLLFPPFENYASATRLSGTYFDSFYFLFGDKSGRNLYVPLLYLEVLCVLINTALLWLLMRDARASVSDA